MISCTPSPFRNPDWVTSNVFSNFIDMEEALDTTERIYLEEIRRERRIEIEMINWIKIRASHEYNRLETRMQFNPLTS